MGDVVAKIVKKRQFLENEFSPFTNEEMHFISFKILSCILRSRNAFSANT